MCCFDFLEKHKEKGLLVLRIGIGVMFIFHGWPKISGGPTVWAKVGAATGYLGLNFAPTFFGFMAALAEFGGGICLILGLFFRPASLLLLCTMIVAASMHLGRGDGMKTASHAIELGIVFLSLLFVGPGPLSLDSKCKCLCTKE